MHKEAEWIDAKLALEKLEVSLGRHAAKQTLAEHLRDGELSAFASSMWLSEAPTLNEAWLDISKTGLKINQELKPSIFRSSKRWSLDPSDWRWPYNKFSITTRLRPTRRRRMLKGVKFRKVDIDRILNYTASSKGGRPSKEEAWTTFWHAVIKLAQDGYLRSDEFPNQASLTKQILADARGISEASARRKIAQIYRKFVAAGG